MQALTLFSLLFFPTILMATAKVSFVKPENKTTVPRTFEVEFKVKDMKVEKAGVMKKKTGHHHLIIDGGPVKKNEVIGKSEKMLHFGDASTKTTLTLEPGPHTLTLQFGDGAHRSYGEKFAETITVNVE